MKISIAILALATVVSLGFKLLKPAHSSAVPYYNTPDCTPIWFQDKSEAEKVITHRIAPFAFLDQTGRVITQATVAGKIHVADFFFTTCSSVCPQMSRQFKLLQDSTLLDTNVVLLSYSVTPWIDSVPKLRAYAADIGARPDKWHLLTGDKEAIYSLARTSYFAEQSDGFARDTSSFLHTEHFVLVDGEERVRGMYNGTLPLERERLLADIRSLEKE